MSLIPLGFWAASGAGGGAGAFDLLETTTLTTSASSVTFSGLGAYSGYKHLQIRLVGRTTRTASNEDVSITFNSDTSTSYTYHSLQGDGSSVTSSSAGTNSSTFAVRLPGNNEAANLFGSQVWDLLDFSSTSKNTTLRVLGGFVGSISRIGLTSGAWLNTAAVTTVGLTPSSGNNFITGSRFSLIGVK